jgi:hypothetical protein
MNSAAQKQQAAEPHGLTSGIETQIAPSIAAHVEI